MDDNAGGIHQRPQLGRHGDACFIRYVMAQEKFSGRIVNVDKLTYAGNPENLAGTRPVWETTGVNDPK